MMQFIFFFFSPVNTEEGGRGREEVRRKGLEEEKGQKEWMQDDGQTRGAASVQLQLDRHGR